MIRATLAFLLLAPGLAQAVPASAKDSLGVYDSWAAFRDDSPTRCYAISKPRRASAGDPYVSIATWPQRRIRGQFYARLTRAVNDDAAVTLTIGNRDFALAASGRNAWAQDTRMDAAIVAAIRSAQRMAITARDTTGRRMTDRYILFGAATAIDAASVGCASRG